MSDKVCTVPGCEKPHYAKGLCVMHRTRLRRTGSLGGIQPQGTPFERVMAKVRITDTCWLFEGRLHEEGYGLVDVYDEATKRSFPRRAHVVVYEHLVGPVPEGKELDHLCRVRRCCNPKCLEAVAPRENCLRGEAPGVLLHKLNRCKRGHELTPANSIVRKNGTRTCRICTNDYKAGRITGSRWRVASPPTIAPGGSNDLR